MKPITTTLSHRVLPPERSGGTPPPLLVFLHGRGADEEDLLGLAPTLDERLFIISARAPFEFEFGGYTWFDMGGELIPDPASFRESCDRLHQFLLDIRSGYSVDPSRMFLFGFSMGTIMSYAMALTKPELVRGVSANSGCIPEGTHLAFRWQELQNVGFFVTHGTYDSVLPVELGRRSAELLKGSNAQFTYREYPADHQLTEEGMKDVAEWMEGLLQ